MSYINTFTGKWFNPLDPDPDLIDIHDIAHALSYLCRANGHFKSFYSVAQHSINCMKEAEARGFSKRVQLAALIHDGSEAYLSDLTRPVKNKFPQYKEIEAPLQKVIYEKWLDQPLNEEEAAQVLKIDDDILYYELLTLMDYKQPIDPPVMSGPIAYDFNGFDASEKEFLQLFSQLSGI